MASALQRLRDNVKEQETFEEKVKRNPAEALRELYSSEEYKNYENMKRSLGYVPPAYDLSDEFKAKEKMAWEELRKIREEEGKEIYGSEEYKRSKEMKDALGFNSYNTPSAYDLSDETKAKERKHLDRWDQIYQYIYGKSDYNPLEDRKVDNKEEISQTNTTSNDTSLETKQENPTTSQNIKEEPHKEETKQASESVKEVEKKTEDSPVYKAIATHKGVVSDVGNDYVKIRYNEKGKIYEESFKGLKDINVKKGDRVKEGQVIGQSDKEINVEKKVVASAGHHHKHHHHKHHHHHNHHHNNHKAGHNENQKVKVERKNENANATNPNNISSKIPGADIIFSSITSGGQNQVSFGNIKDQIKLERNKNIQLTNKPEEPKVAMSVAPGM